MSSNAGHRTCPSLGRCALAGLLAGMAAAILANLAHALLSQATGLRFRELNFLSITRASLIACVLGGLVFYAAARWTKHPVAWFAVAGLLVTTADSLFVMLHPPQPGFDRLANPLHFIVGLITIVLLPRLARGRNSPLIQGDL